MIETKDIMQWAYKTVLYAAVANGADITLDDVHRIVECEIIHDLTDVNEDVESRRLMIKRIFDRAISDLDDMSVHEEDRSTCDIEQTKRIMTWVINCFAAAHTYRYENLTYEELCCEADKKVICHIQGNKKNLPTVSDLDYVVQRAIRVVHTMIDEYDNDVE